MEAILQFPAFLLILAAPFIGSFAGLVIDRLPAGRPLLWGRSACERCAHRLGVRDLVPVASWLANLGRCRFCDGTVSPLYPVLELSIAAVAVWSLLVVPGGLAYATFGLGTVLATAAVIDWRHGLLPDALTLPLIPAGLAIHLSIGPASAAQATIGVVAGYAIVVIVRALYQWLRRREGIGLGDAKLLAAAGAWVSWQGLPGVLLLAAAAALLVNVLAVVRRRRLAPQDEVAFGPYLAGAFWIVWLYGLLQLG